MYIVSLLFRLLNAYLCQSFFQPDEPWQSLELAHHHTFHYGYTTWEWRISDSNTWWQGGKGGIRSPLGIVPTALVYQILKWTGFDNRGDWLIIAPRFLQAFIAASTDVAVQKLAGRVLGEKYRNAALFVSLTSFFNFYTSTRTFSNSTETALTAWALCYWPWEAYNNRNDRVKKDKSSAVGETNLRVVRTEDWRESSLLFALSSAALATIVRPSNAIIWIVLGLGLFFHSSKRQQFALVNLTILIGVFAVLFSFILDTSFYSTPTFTPLRFLSTNVFNSISLFYGQSPWHFYFSQGIPFLLLTQLPFFLHGYYIAETSPSPTIENRRASKELRWTAVRTIVAFSLLSHKEWRFLHPILPILHIVVTLSLVHLGELSTSSKKTSLSKTRNRFSNPILHLSKLTRIKPSHIYILLFSLIPATYLTTFHQRGQNDVMIWIRNEMRKSNDTTTKKEGIETIGFLMPCHSTPWQAYIHSKRLEGNEGRGDKMWFITCEPPILGQPANEYLDQTDHFYNSPSTYLLDRFPRFVDPYFPPSPHPPIDPYALPLTSAGVEELRLDLKRRKFDLGWNHTWPSHLVVFSNLLDHPCLPSEPSCRTVGELLESKGYVVEKKFWNGLRGWHEDERRKGGIVVLKWVDSERPQELDDW